MLVLNWFVMEILLGSSKFYFMVVISKNNNNKVLYIYILWGAIFASRPSVALVVFFGLESHIGKTPFLF